MIQGSLNKRLARIWSFTTASLLILVVLCHLPALAEESYFIGFAQDTLGNDWRLAQVMEVKKEFDKHANVKFVYTDGKGDTAMQAMHIEELLNRGIDLLITSPREKAVLSDVITKVYQQGIPVVLLDRGIDGDAYTTFIHPDNIPIAKAAAEYLVETLDGRGEILMLEGVPGATPTLHRSQSFLEVINRHRNLKVFRRTANYLRADAILAVERLLVQGKKFDAIYAQSDSMAEGARMALKYHGIDPRSIPIVGIDYIHEAQQAIRLGEQAISFTYPTGGIEGARAALMILDGKRVPKEIILESIKVSKENVNLVSPIF
ncbi:MAG: substrate-binding domain-containing protein [Candidatus Thiodiazotropha sp.]